MRSPRSIMARPTGITHPLLLGTTSVFCLLAEPTHAQNASSSLPKQHQTTQKKAPSSAQARQLTVSDPHPTAAQPVAGGTEAVIVTGTREIGKKARDSISPVDIITARQLF